MYDQYLPPLYTFERSPREIRGVPSTSPVPKYPNLAKFRQISTYPRAPDPRLIQHTDMVVGRPLLESVLSFYTTLQLSFPHFCPYQLAEVRAVFRDSWFKVWSMVVMGRWGFCTGFCLCVFLSVQV